MGTYSYTSTFQTVVSAMADAINKHRLRSMSHKPPTYIYLGKEERAEFEQIERYSWGDRFNAPPDPLAAVSAPGMPGEFVSVANANNERRFMGVRVIYVDEPSHLAVGD